MDRNTIIGLLMIFAIFIGFTIYNQPSKEELEKIQHRRDSLAMVQMQRDTSRIAVEEVNQKNEDSQLSAREFTQAETTEMRDKLGYFANAGRGEDKEFVIENDVIKIRISKKGGKILNVRLKKYQTYDSLPLDLFNHNNPKFGYTFFSNSRIINTSDLYFEPFYTDKNWQGKDSLFVTENDTLSFAMRLYTSNGDSSFNKNQYIEYVYTLYGENYMMNYDINLVGMNNVIDPVNKIDLIWETDLRRQERSIENERNEATIYYKYSKDEVDYLTETKDLEESLVTSLKWLSFKTKFFVASLIAESAFTNANVKTFTNEGITEEHYLKTLLAQIGVPFLNQPVQNFAMNFYFGPNKYNTLRKFHLDLERQVPLGWSFFLMAWINIYAVIPVFDWLGGYGWNYGIVILILTILLKIVLFPIAYKTYKSSAKMRVLKPEIDELGKKFPKTEDAMKKQQATMALYKKAGVNPMAGCVPMLLQFPILIAMFRFFPSSIELRQQSFLWANDLSSYDSILNLPFEIPFYGAHVSLFTLLMTISTIFYTKLNNDMMGSTNQMPGMKTMMYLMPIMFLGMFNNFASGLSYYYLLANLLTFAQMYLIRKTIDEDRIHLQIQENKKKPVKVSKFQERLEAMAKQRGYNPNASKKK